jgi:hypothetical protein
MSISYTTALATTEFSLSEPKIWTNGMKVDVSSIANGVNISLNSSGINNDINVAYIYNVGFSFPNSTSALKFHITQHSTSNLWMDFILEDINKNKKALDVDGAAILYRDGSMEPEVVKLKNLSLNLYNEFNGDIYIPFRYLKINDLNTNNDQKDFDIKNIISSGFTFTIDKDKTSEIEVTNLNLLGKEEDTNINMKLDATITGEDSLQISEVAESSSHYIINGNEKNDFSFIPIDGVSGISITKDGILTVDENATNQVIKIKAISKDGLYISKNVTIYKSWINTQSNQEIKIPTPDQIKSIKNNYDIFSNEKVLTGIRSSCLLFVFIFGLSYCLSRRKIRR